MSSFWGRLFDERRDSNRSLGAFVFWRLLKISMDRMGLKGQTRKVNFCKQGTVDKRRGV